MDDVEDLSEDIGRIEEPAGLLDEVGKSLRVWPMIPASDILKQRVNQAHLLS
jgi:hypothetical protein